MKYLLKPHFIAFIIAAVISGLFLWMVLTPPSVFNMLPSKIHELITLKVISEAKFITIFDIVVALILLLFAYIKLYNSLNHPTKQ